MNPVAVTGLGLFLPGYQDPVKLLTRLSCGKSLLKKKYLDAEQTVSLVCSSMEADDLEEVERHYPYLKTRYINVTTKIRVYAAMQAVNTSGIDPEAINDRCGLFVGCNKNLPDFTNQ